MIRVEFNSSSFQLAVIVWMGQVSDIVAAQPELVPEAVSCLKGLFCTKGVVFNWPISNPIWPKLASNCPIFNPKVPN